MTNQLDSTVGEPQKVYLNGRFLSQRITGVQRYAHELTKALDVLIGSGRINADRHSFCILAPRNAIVDPGFDNIPVKMVGRLTGHAWEQIELPFYARDGLLVNLCNTGPLLRGNQTVTIHDASVYSAPEAYSLPFRIWYRLNYRVLGRRCSAIITVSHFSKDELNRHSLGSGKVRVVYESGEHFRHIDADTSVVRDNGLDNSPFVLAVSSLNPNKNFPSVIRAIEILTDHSFKVAIAGGTNDKVFSGPALPDSGRVVHLGYVSDAQMKALYESAACLVYPSFYEGFGLPPMEAMTCGCPTIVSNTSSMPEIFGDAALYCDPYRPADIADKIRLIVTNPGMRHELRRKGQDHAAQFSWESCAINTFNLIGELV